MKLTDDEASKATGGICDPALLEASTELYNYVSQAGTTSAHLEVSGGSLWEQRVHDTEESTILRVKNSQNAGKFEIKHAWDQEFGDTQ